MIMKKFYYSINITIITTFITSFYTHTIFSLFLGKRNNIYNRRSHKFFMNHNDNECDVAIIGAGYYM